MNRLLLVTCFGLLSMIGVGCRAPQLGNDQDKMRCVLLKLHTNQIMDNLVRADKGLPMLQLDYIHMTGTVTDTANASVGGSQTNTANRFFNIPGVVAAMSHVFTNVYTYGAGGMQVNQLTVTAEPVIANSADVYNAYLAFLDKPGRLLKTAEPPPCDTALIVYPCDGCYYWVPKQYRIDFLELSLAAMSIRGEAIKVPDAFETTVLGVERAEDLGNKDYRLTLRLSKKIPNDNGFIEVALGGVFYNLKLLSDDTTKEKTTARFRMLYAQGAEKGQVPLAPAAVEKALANQQVRIKLDTFRPGVPKTENLLDDLRHQTELFRLDQAAK